MAKYTSFLPSQPYFINDLTCREYPVHVVDACVWIMKGYRKFIAYTSRDRSDERNSMSWCWSYSRTDSMQHVRDATMA